jgi:hypothetical protein
MVVGNARTAGTIQPPPLQGSFRLVRRLSADSLAISTSRSVEGQCSCSRVSWAIAPIASPHSSSSPYDRLVSRDNAVRCFASSCEPGSCEAARQRALNPQVSGEDVWTLHRQAAALHSDLVFALLGNAVASTDDGTSLWISLMKLVSRHLRVSAAGISACSGVSPLPFLPLATHKTEVKTREQICSNCIKEASCILASLPSVRSHPCRRALSCRWVVTWFGAVTAPDIEGLQEILERFSPSN